MKPSLSAIILCLAASAPVYAAGPDSALLGALCDPAMRESHAFRLRQGAAEPTTADGAIGEGALWAAGKAKSLFLDEQRRGTDFLIQPGIALKDTPAVSRGITVIDFGFKQMAKDGSFPGVPDVTHGAEFFLEGAARAMLLLQAADDPQATTVGARWKPELTTMVAWFLQPRVAMAKPDHDLYPFNHRYYARAAGLAEAAVVLQRPDLMAEANRYALLGVALQRPDGVNPEKGGFDAGYQVAGLLYAEYFAYLTPDAKAKAAVVTMISHALDLLVSKTAPDGKLDPAGSTRMAKEKDREGVTKKVNFAAYAQILVLGADLTGRADLHHLGEAVEKNYVAGTSP